MVIVGAGECGARAALTLREQGWDGAITLIGEEALPPYERPPLSKAVMVTDPEPAPAHPLTAESVREKRIDLISGMRVAQIDRDAHEIVLGDGRRISYVKLLLATGAQPRRLTVEGAEPGNVLYLRSFADAQALRAKLLPGTRLCIIGGGFIGLELAASATKRGCVVTVLEAAARILMRGVPAPLAALIQRRHEQAGVAFRIGTGMARIAADKGGKHVVLTDGSEIACDVIIAGIGAVPDTQLAEAASLAIENGIRVDGRLTTSDPDIFAAGDCCSFPHPLYGERRVRLEAWRNALDQGALAARNMLGAGQTYDTVPWFWSDQYELTLHIAGLSDQCTRHVKRNLGDGAELHFHLGEDGRLMAASGFGPIGKVAKEIKLAEMLVQRSARPAADQLASPDVRLKSLLNG
ncbi:MAG TPA: FAD-dependent oxidoreductase [Dongiaceae bacterium]|nr:FAD-dependent oxidoreductase [Dongiaceae bacterium]